MLKKLGRSVVACLGYLFYILVMLGLCLWLLFPRDSLHRLLIRSLDAAFAPVQWRVGTLAFDFPLAVRLDRIEGYGLDDDKKPLVHIDSLRVTPDIPEMAKTRQLRATYEMTLAKGTVAGALSMRDRRSGLRFDGAMQEIQLPELAALTRPLQREVQGVAAGSFTGGVTLKPLVLSELQAKVRVENGRLELLQPVLGHAALPFARAAATIALRGDRVQVADGAVDSKLFAGEFAGEVRLNQDFAVSTIAVKGRLQPRPELFREVAGNAAALQVVRLRLKDRPLPFRLSGELRSPAIHFEEYAVLLETLEKRSK